MAVTKRASSSGSFDAVATVTPGLPTGTTNGDFTILCFEVSDTDAITNFLDPGDWEIAGDSDNEQIILFRMWLSGDTVADPVLSWTTSADGQWQAVTYQNVGSWAIMEDDLAGGVNFTAADTESAPPWSNVTSDDLWVMAAAIWDNTDTIVSQEPAGYTEDVAVYDATDDCGGGVWSKAGANNITENPGALFGGATPDSTVAAFFALYEDNLPARIHTNTDWQVNPAAGDGFSADSFSGTSFDLQAAQTDNFDSLRTGDRILAFMAVDATQSFGSTVSWPSGWTDHGTHTNQTVAVGSFVMTSDTLASGSASWTNSVSGDIWFMAVRQAGSMDIAITEGSASPLDPPSLDISFTTVSGRDVWFSIGVYASGKELTAGSSGYTEEYAAFNGIPDTGIRIGSLQSDGTEPEDPGSFTGDSTVDDWMGVTLLFSPSQDASTSPATINAVAAVPSVTTKYGGAPAPATVNAPAALDDDPLHPMAQIFPSSLDGVGGIPAPTLGQGETISVSSVDVVSAFGPDMDLNWGFIPGDVVATAGIPAPAGLGSGVGSDTSVSCSAGIPTPTVNVGSNLSLTSLNLLVAGLGFRLQRPDHQGRKVTVTETTKSKARLPATNARKYRPKVSA